MPEAVPETLYADTWDAVGADVQPVVEAILKHARTGSIGDGKVFVLPVEEAYRIRTGESGEETLQAHPEAAAQAAS